MYPAKKICSSEKVATLKCTQVLKSKKIYIICPDGLKGGQTSGAPIIENASLKCPREWQKQEEVSDWMPFTFLPLPSNGLSPPVIMCITNGISLLIN